MTDEPTETRPTGYLRRVRTTYSASAPAYRNRRPRWRRPLIVLVVIVVLLGVGGYAAYNAYQRYVVRLLTVPGCSAGFGANTFDLDFGQAQDAAVIAGVAVRDGLPSRALIIAYATAMQESKLENLSYGDRDSVGLFQQRPSEGWGTTAELEDPAYATQAFFKALVKVPHYTTIPVWQAAQDVQRSAGGDAYEQYAANGAQLAAAYTTQPHAVTCWYTPSSQSPTSAKLNLKGALKSLKDTFGESGKGDVVTEVSKSKTGQAVTLHAASGHGWMVASWLVANASYFGISQVSYAGQEWTAQLTETGWQADSSATGGGVVAR
jgi:hypothetical protein